MEQQEQELLRLDGVVANVIYQNEENGYAVFEVEAGTELHVATGVVPSINPGETVALYGQFETHPVHGPQFKVASCELSMPQDVAGILSYLSSGVLPYIGPATARKIVDRFGADSLEIIGNDYMQLTELKGITPKKAQAINAEFKKMFGLREAMAYLSRFNIRPVEAVEVFRQFGPSTVEAISSNPYLLCGEPLHKPFKEVDAIAAELQIDWEGPLRVWACLQYTLRHNSGNGHTCLPEKALVDTVSKYIQVNRETVQTQLEEAAKEGDICLYQYGENRFVYLPDLLSAERDIAARLWELSHRPTFESEGLERSIQIMEQAQGFSYAPEQREAIRLALCSNVMVLTGGPGTGKTTTVNAILSIYQHQADRVALCAPTGRAAKRLSELTGQKAQTIHRLLEVDFDVQSGLLRFIHNEKNLLKYDVIVMDEMSMVDVKLFQSLLAAMRYGCRLIMVGDTDQLPCVGPGNVLGDVIASGVVPTVCLNKIFRQSEQSLIVENAHRIMSGQQPKKQTREGDYFFLNSCGLAAQELICSLVSRRLPQAYGFDPVMDIQVLCPTKQGPVGTAALNPVLQELLNPPAFGKRELTANGRIFREGDKVMQVRNNYLIPYERDGGEAGVGAFNGDLGVVLEVDTEDRSLLVSMDDRKLRYTSDLLGELEIAYAITVHKSQGSEFAAIVVPVSDVPVKLRYRNLLYTGVTRAKKLCVLVGSESVVQEMIGNTRQNQRYSCLANMLAHGNEL